MTSIKGVVFDFDGTITRPFFDFGMIKDEIGMPRDVLILEYLEGKDKSFVEHANKVLDKWELKAAKESELNDNVLEVLQLLSDKSIKTAVLTRNTNLSVDMVVEKFGLRFDYIHTRDMQPVKPDPESMKTVLKEIDLEPEEVITIGDYEHDIECGKSVGTMAMFITNGNGKPELRTKPDYIIEDFYEGLEILKDLIK